MVFVELGFSCVSGLALRVAVDDMFYYPDSIVASTAKQGSFIHELGSLAKLGIKIPGWHGNGDLHHELQRFQADRFFSPVSFLSLV